MTSAHSATGPALGYQYQADYCLLEFLTNAGPGRAITLELLDDVAWEEEGTPSEQLQIKHKVNASGGLGDKSDAMWRTLKVWMDAGGAADIDGPALVLVSSGTAQPGSAAFALRRQGWDPLAAAAALRAAAAPPPERATAVTAGLAQSPVAVAMTAAREKFNRMGVADQNSFVGRIIVVDRQPTVIEVDAEIRERLYLQLPREPAKADHFMESLWGWWRGRVVEMLAHRYFPGRNLRVRVDSSDLRAQLQRLTTAHSEEGLPEFEQFDVANDHPELAGLGDEAFVHQMKLVKAHHTAIRRAIVDFYRATSSETEWFRGDYLRTDEVIKYEQRLRDAWEVAFANMLTSLGDDATDAQQIAAGQRLLAETLQKVPLRIRTHVEQDFYYRGKHHMLAQGSNFGWHPDFEARVSALLAPAAVSP